MTIRMGKFDLTNKWLGDHKLMNEASFIHIKIAALLAASGLSEQSGKELAKSSFIISAYKEERPNLVKQLMQILREHVGLGRKTALEVAEATVRDRDLFGLNFQKGWDLDGTALAIGCEKIRRIGLRPDFLIFMDRLVQLSESIGIDQELYDIAMGFIDEDEPSEKVSSW